MKRFSLVVSCATGVLAAAAALGCGAVIQQLNGGGTSDAHPPPAEGGIYTGAECAHWQKDDARGEGVFQTYTDDAARRPIFKGMRPAGKTPAESATFLTCIDATGPNPVDWSDGIVADHVDFDDRRFDHLRAAAMVMDCALNPECSVAQARDVLGMVAGYERRVDPAAADAEFAAAGASAPLRQAFAAKLTWARGLVQQRVTELDPRRKAIWVDVPEQVWTARADYFKRYAKLYAEADPALDAAQNGSGDQAAAARTLRTLRGRYLDACKVEGCLFTAFVFETTRALTLIAVRQRDVPTALAEAALLGDDRLQSQVFSRAMLAALLPATTREAEAYQKYSAAKSDGGDETALRAMFGDTPPINISPDGPWIVWGKKSIPDLTAALPKDDVASAGGNVRSVKRSGDRAVITFADVVTTYDEEDCHETNKIDGISSSGSIIYRQDCKKTGTHTERTKVEPVNVSAEEAAGLRPGEYVSAYVAKDSRKGAVVDVQREDAVVQVRGHRLKVKEHRPRDER